MLRHSHGLDNTIAPHELPGHLPAASGDQRAGQGLPARVAGAGRAQEPPRRDGLRAASRAARDRRRAGRVGHDVRGGHAARPAHVLADVEKGTRRARRARDRRRARRARRVVGDAVARARRRVPPRRRARRRAVAPDAQRRDDAQPVQDGAPGRDRRRLRDVRLPPLQRRVPRPHLRGAADLVARRLEPARVPAAGGVRLRREPVQLHDDRHQPDHLPGADGQHRDLEAGVDRGPVGPLRARAARGSRPAAGRDQPRVRLGRRDRRCRAAQPGARRHPLHGLDARLPEHVAHGRREHRELPRLPAPRRRDRRQGLHPRPPLRRPRRGRDGDRARLVRVPGAEVLRLVAALHPVEPLAAGARPAADGRLVDRDGRRARLHQLHGRGHRRRLVRDAGWRHRRGEGRPAPRSSRAVAPTTRRAGSSSPP